MSVFCVVDKSYGESHSFVDGMLENILLKSDVNSILVRSSSYNADFSTERSSSIIRSRFTRKGIGRVFYPIESFFYYLFFSRNNKFEIIFIRNEILVLLLFVLYKVIFRKINLNIIFQSSFPHEDYSVKGPVRYLVKFLLKHLLPICSKIIVVSERAGRRINNLCGNSEIVIVPLCTDFSIIEPNSRDVNKVKKGRDFLYIGTFARLRSLDKVIIGFKQASDISACSLTLVGGCKEEFLIQYPHCSDIINELLDTKKLKFLGKVNRNLIPKIMEEHAYGLNLIPPIEVYKESSSTKLGEYLSQGMPVISSNGIDYHHKVHELGDVGCLVDFNIESISRIMIECSSEQLGEKYLEKSNNGIELVSNHLVYENYFSSVFDY